MEVSKVLERYYNAFINQLDLSAFFLGLGNYTNYIFTTPILKNIADRIIKREEGISDEEARLEVSNNFSLWLAFNELSKFQKAFSGMGRGMNSDEILKEYKFQEYPNRKKIENDESTDIKKMFDDLKMMATKISSFNMPKNSDLKYLKVNVLNRSAMYVQDHLIRELNKDADEISDKIFSLVFVDDSSNKKRLIINKNYSLPIEIDIKTKNWKYIFDIAKNGSVIYIKSYQDYFNSNKKCKLYTKSRYKIQQILKKTSDYSEKNIDELIVISSKIFTRRKNNNA